jgi:hypothetical protein
MKHLVYYSSEYLLLRIRSFSPSLSQRSIGTRMQYVSSSQTQYHSPVYPHFFSSYWINLYFITRINLCFQPKNRQLFPQFVSILADGSDARLLLSEPIDSVNTLKEGILLFISIEIPGNLNFTYLGHSRQCL